MAQRGTANRRVKGSTIGVGLEDLTREISHLPTLDMPPRSGSWAPAEILWPGEGLAPAIVEQIVEGRQPPYEDLHFEIRRLFSVRRPKNLLQCAFKILERHHREYSTHRPSTGSRVLGAAGSYVVRRNGLGVLPKFTGEIHVVRRFHRLGGQARQAEICGARWSRASASRRIRVIVRNSSVVLAHGVTRPEA